MIALLGLLFLTLASPASLGASVPESAGLVPSSEASASSSRSFEQISKLAMEAWNDNRDENAIALFAKGLKMKPDWNEGLWYLGVLYYDRDRFSDARNLLRHYLAQNPKQGAGWAMVGICDYQLREYGRALEQLNHAVSLGLGARKQLADTVFYDQAILLTRDGQFEASTRLLYLIRGDAGARAQGPLEVPAGLNALSYQLLPEEVPSNRLEFVRLMGAAVFARLDQQRDKAKAILRDLAADHPSEKGVHYQYGSMLLEEDLPGGVEEMLKVLDLSSFDTAARLQLARYYIQHSRAEKAKPYVDEALKLAPSNPTAHLLNGNMLEMAGDLQAAISELELARQTDPEEPQVLWALLHVYTAAGRREDAARVKDDIAKVQAKSLSTK